MTHPILTCAESAAFEESILGGDPGREWDAMNQVGQQLAHQILLDFNELRPFPRDPAILVLAGKGHNAGDALLAAHQLLKARPRSQVSLLATAAPDQLRPNTRRAYDALAAEKACTPVQLDDIQGRQFDISLDGLLGMQFKPPLRSPLDTLVPTLNRCDNISFRAAVDLPSGLGDQSAEEPLRADFTYATGIAKTPLFFPESLQWTGRVRYLDIGFFDPCAPDTHAGAHILTDSVLDPLRGLRSPDCDKRTHGHLFVLGGSRTMPGALLMTVRAALKSGVGLVTAFAPESATPHLAAAAPEAMWVPCPETPHGHLSLEGQYLLHERISKATALAIGPGMGDERETHALLQVVLQKDSTLPVVLDADALRPEVIGSLNGPAVLTPHAGEMARIVGTTTEEVTAETAWSHAATFGAAHNFDHIVLLKGPHTYVTGGEHLEVTTFGGPVLARGGSGDLLTGLVGGLLAQGNTPLDAARRGAVWHGQAAEHLARSRGHTAVTAPQLLNYLHEPLRP